MHPEPAGAGRFRAFSAGSHPKGEINPHTIETLKKLNYVTDDLRSKSWDEFAVPGAPELQFVFTVCDQAAQEVCPLWPGQPMSAHLGIPAPAAVEGNEAERRIAFAGAYRILFNRISIFVNLPMASLDRLTLQRRLDEIGRQGRPPGKTIRSAWRRAARFPPIRSALSRHTPTCPLPS